VIAEVNYPHGLCFTPDGRHLLVADAGSQCVNVYRSDDGDWRGTRSPRTACRLIDDNAFLQGRYNPEEGGINGIDIDPGGRLLAATCGRMRLVWPPRRASASTRTCRPRSARETAIAAWMPGSVTQ
jgi:sugar lactone lactonase YvrE